ncbi:MAG: pyridoxamine 5'-phosphate oxidase family protein [Lachnospiraceae bacterium]
MFRKMRRFKQALTEQECIEILQNSPRGILAVHGEDGYPYALPMNFIYRNDRLFFHCAKEGHKIDALAMNNKVSFCVLNEGYKKEGEWALNIGSVIIFGKMIEINDWDTIIEIARGLALKHYPTPEAAEAEVNKVNDRVQMLELVIDHMSGKLVNES